MPETKRAALRGELGAVGEDKLLLHASSRWQQPEVQNFKHHQRVARRLPDLVAPRLAGLGPLVKVVHVGPAPFGSWSAGMGERYRWLPPVSSERLDDLLGAADLLLSFNTTGTITISAVARGLPVVVAINSHHGRTVEEVAADLPQPPAEAVRRWLAEVVPLHPFRIWPLGLYRFLSPVLAGNPFTRAFRTVEVLDEEGFVQACRELLFDDRARARQQEEQQAYREEVSRLPSAGEVFRNYV
jgi:uncharacterized protein DUF6365